MEDKRLRKENYLRKELENYQTVNVYGNISSSTAILCWGSNKGVCVEAAKGLGLKVIQPVVLCPFPLERLKSAIGKTKNLICVENNATAQLSGLLGRYGIKTNRHILKYDGRPFSLEELEEKLKSSIS
jgi:2-oxoglutarate ferredoxin oxidoreductase subunit alpha